jgi:hypothetical protein
MKNKIKILLAFSALFIFCANELFALTVTLSGGTPHPNGTVTYNYVYASTHTVNCNGSGPNACPVSRAHVSGTSGTWYEMDAILDLVKGKIEGGEISGEINYKDDLPVSWSGKNTSDYTVILKETGYEPTK